MHDLVNFYGSVNNDNITTDPVWLAQMKRAFELWSSLDLEQVDVWLQDLAQALQQSRFDEEYQRLLPQGLDKLVEATLLLIGVGDISVNSEQARRSIESMLSVILEGNDPLSGIRWMQEIAEAAACQRVVGVCQLLAPSPFWLVWKALYWDPFKNAWDQFLSLFVNPRTQQLSEDGYLASLAIMHIVTNMAKYLLPPVVVISDLGFNEGMESFRAFLEWAYANRSHLDQTLGTLFAAASAGLSGWHVHPFRVEPGWVSAVLLLPLVDHRIPGINRDIMVLLRGDNCQNCAAKADQIVQWVIDALKRIKDQTPFSGLAFSYSDDMRMIVLSFTNPKARGVDEVIRRLQENSTIATNKDVVIVVVYWDKTANKPAIACISKACEDMKQNNPDGYRELMEKLKNSFIQALDAAMRAYPDLPADAAWHLAFAACQGDTDCILWIAEQLNKEQNNP